MNAKEMQNERKEKVNGNECRAKGEIKEMIVIS